MPEKGKGAVEDWFDLAEYTEPLILLYFSEWEYSAYCVEMVGLTAPLNWLIFIWSLCVCMSVCRCLLWLL
jgi:hypothetical protein